MADDLDVDAMLEAPFKKEVSACVEALQCVLSQV